MFGWIIGTVCLIALIRTVKRHRYGRYYGFTRFGHFAARRGFAGRGLLRGLFMQLETTPGQENAIVAALDEMFENLHGLKTEFTGTRRDFAALLGSSTLDREGLDSLLARQRGNVEVATNEVVRFLTRVHESLDDSQRRELGALIAEGSLGPSVLRGYRRPYHPAYGF